MPTNKRSNANRRTGSNRRSNSKSTVTLQGIIKNIKEGLKKFVNNLKEKFKGVYMPW